MTNVGTKMNSALIPLRHYPGIVYYDNFFTDEEISLIDQLAAWLPSMNGTTLEDFLLPEQYSEKNPYRKSEVKWLEFNDENAWLFNSTIEKIIQTNFRYFNLELTAMESLQHTTYNAPTDTYGPHVDITNISPLHRKLSFTVQLSDPSEYEGGDLMLYDYGLDVKPAPKTKGSVVIFYSHILHEVTPVTSGTRKALVGWFSGPPLK